MNLITQNPSTNKAMSKELLQLELSKCNQKALLALVGAAISNY